MSDVKYTYSIDQFPNNKFDLSKLDREIRSSTIETSLNYLSGSESQVDIYFRNVLLGKDWTTLSGVASSHDGEDDFIEYTPVKLMASDESVSLNTSLFDEYRDRSGKLRVHQTSRKLGTVICWSGEGDDTSNPSLVGGGNSFSFIHSVGQSISLPRYIDFNIVENETWVHEGYITWNNCYLDTLDLLVVPRVTDVSTSSGTNYNLYGGYLVVPAAPGTGTISINSDITTHSGGLVYMPPNDLGVKATAYWNATWNETTKRFEDIIPSYNGTGDYNMFSIEVPFAHFVRKIPLLNSGFIPLNSSDTDQLGTGMRLKMVANTNTTVSGIGDHEWSLACIMCLHRARTL